MKRLAPLAVAAALTLTACGGDTDAATTVSFEAGGKITGAKLDISHYCLRVLDDKWSGRSYDQALDAINVLTEQLYRDPDAVMDVGDETVRQAVVDAADSLDGCDDRLMARLDRALARAAE